MYLNRIHTATFLPFIAYNTDNQLITDTLAVLGARLTVTYRSLVTSETSAKRETVKAGCSSNILSVFQINVNESYRDSLITKNKEQLLIYS